jgi:ROK family
LYQGSRGLVEGGHIIIDNKNQGRKCSCGQVGCVEAYSSGKNTSIRMFEMDVAEERERAKKRASFSVYPDKVIGKIKLRAFAKLYIYLRCADFFSDSHDWFPQRLFNLMIKILKIIE